VCSLMKARGESCVGKVEGIYSIREDCEEGLLYLLFSVLADERYTRCLIGYNCLHSFPN